MCQNKAGLLLFNLTILLVNVRTHISSYSQESEPSNGAGYASHKESLKKKWMNKWMMNKYINKKWENFKK